MTEFDRLSTVSIQGGGVFGLSLLGQLGGILSSEKAARPVVVAGSSAGAIISTLHWAGYSASDVLQEVCDKISDRSLRRLVESADETENVLRVADIRKLRGVLNEILAISTTFSGRSVLPGWRTLRRLYAYSHLLAQRGLIAHLFKRIENRGLFTGERFVRWLDGLLLPKLNEALARNGKPPAPEGHRATFRDFFEADLNQQGAGTFSRSLLIIVLANVSRRDFLPVDSHSQAFEHLPVSDVVRASIAFPGFFTPKELTIWRDSTTGEIADAKTVEAQDPERHPFLSRELFVDGGVISNFPSWLVLDLAREIMWGKNLFGEYVRLGRGCDFENIENALDCADQRDRPLRHLAFRPMVHFGLQLLSDAPRPASGPAHRRTHPDEFAARVASEFRHPGVFWTELGGFISGGSRGQLELKLLEYQLKLTSSRFVNVRQPLTTAGWQFGSMDFHRLKVGKATAMYDAGAERAAALVGSLNFKIPSGEKQRTGAKATLKDDICYMISETQASLARSPFTEKTPKVFVSLFVIRGAGAQPDLIEYERYGESGRLRATESFPLVKEDGDINQPEQFAYQLRTPFFCRRDPSWHNPNVIIDGAGATRGSSFRYIEAIFDNLETRSSFDDVINPEHYIDEISLTDARQHLSERFSVGTRKSGVIFGVLRIDVLIDGADSHADLAEQWSAILSEPDSIPFAEFAKCTAVVSDAWSRHYGRVGSDVG